ncbi:MAG: glutathione S-transferase family protein [Pseudolabrys sp.]|nr:glutathione S-transferase family protein [Pseudolabrys sp.]
MALTLVIGNKNYSSWSFRPWVAMKVAGIPFEEVLIPLYRDGSKDKILSYSPGGKVPALVDGNIKVWESLAVLEYLADKFPDRKLWPDDPAARAQARSVAAEMHAGFAPLRNACPMNMRRPPKPVLLADDVKANIARIEALWSDCRARYGKTGPFLFGAFTAADAMYAPVVSRFETYAIDVTAATRSYMAATIALPAWQEWRSAGIKEPWTLHEDEVDETPSVPL